VRVRGGIRGVFFVSRDPRSVPLGRSAEKFDWVEKRSSCTGEAEQDLDAWNGGLARNGSCARAGDTDGHGVPWPYG
jgi:hypothetical protein